MLNEPLILAAGAVVLLGFAAGVGLMTARQMRSREQRPEPRKITLQQVKPAAAAEEVEAGQMTDPAIMEARERERLVKALQIGHTGEAARAYANLAGLAFARGETRAAERLFSKAVELDQAIGELARTAGNACNLGLVHLAQGDLQAAQDRLEQGRAMFVRLGDQPRVSYIDKLLAMFVTRNRMLA